MSSLPSPLKKFRSGIASIAVVMLALPVAQFTPAAAASHVPASVASLAAGSSVSSSAASAAVPSMVQTGDGEASGAGTSQPPGSVSGSAGSSGSGGSSGGGYHDSWYSGWAEWPEGSAVTNNPRVTAPEFKGYVNEHGNPVYLDQTSPHYNVGTLTLREAMLKAWRKESFKWVRQNGREADVDTPSIERKCRQGTEYSDAGMWGNPLGFQYTVRVQWYNAGGGTAIEPTLREFHFGYKNDPEDASENWKNVGCQAEPGITVGNRVCPQYLEEPKGWYTKEKFYLPYGKVAAKRNSSGWITSPDEILGEIANPDPRVGAAWSNKPGSISGGEEWVAGGNSLVSDSWLKEMDLLADYGRLWNQGWVEKGDWANTDYGKWKEKSWNALRDMCGAGNALRGEFEFADSRTGAFSNLLGHRFASSKGWTKKCPTVSVDEATFKVPGRDIVSPKERHWLGCGNTTPIDKRPAAEGYGLLNVSIDQYTLTCPGVDTYGFPQINQVGLDPYLSESWRNYNNKNQNATVRTFTLGATDFANQAASCVPTEPQVDCKANVNPQYLQPYTEKPGGTEVNSNVSSPDNPLFMDINFEKQTDIEIVYPGWYNTVLDAQQQQRMKPTVRSRSISFLDNGAIPEVADGIPNNEPVLIYDVTNGGSTLLNENVPDDYSKHGSDNGLTTYSYTNGFEAELPGTTKRLKLRFLKSTGVVKTPNGGVRKVEPGETSLAATPSGFAYGKVVAAEGSEQIAAFLEETGLNVGDKAALSTDKGAGWIGKADNITIDADMWNYGLTEFTRPVLSMEYVGGEPVLYWSKAKLEAESFGDLLVNPGAKWRDAGVKSFVYMKWDPNKQAAEGDASPVPLNVSFQNNWQVEMPIFEWEVGPGFQPKPVVTGWETKYFDGCGVGETAIYAVKARGGSGS